MNADAGEARKKTGTTVIADMSVSLDGFVADSADGVERVFAWYGKPQPSSQPPEPDPGKAGAAGLGVIVYGRRTFDVARGWGGRHPTGAPVIVVTHSVPDGWPREESTVSFATDGMESAMHQAVKVAGDKVIALGSPSIIQQCLDLGVVDHIQVKLVPLLLGHGIRLFGQLKTAPIELEGPEITEGNGVTHLHFRVPFRVP
jgi:dihydrofolate reductase